MSCAVVGILLTDLNFILVYYFYKRLPGGYQFLVVAPILEGLLGGEYTIANSTIAPVVLSFPLSRSILHVRKRTRVHGRLHPAL